MNEVNDAIAARAALDIVIVNEAAATHVTAAELLSNGDAGNLMDAIVLAYRCNERQSTALEAAYRKAKTAIVVAHPVLGDSESPLHEWAEGKGREEQARMAREIGV